MANFIVEKRLICLVKSDSDLHWNFDEKRLAVQNTIQILKPHSYGYTEWLMTNCFIP